MTETRNALEELAKWLKQLVDANGGKKCRAVANIDKAQRIVAELAKVSDGHWEVICDGPPAYFCTAGDLKVQCSIGRCRAIAEEGEVRDDE